MLVRILNQSMPKITEEKNVINKNTEFPSIKSDCIFGMETV